MNLWPIVEALKRCGPSGGNIFVLAFFGFIAVVLAIVVVSAMMQHH
jgi:hypothetical protein